MTDPTDHAPRRPDFVVIGAMKAGTTSLYHYLRDHPQIFMPKVKELDFFIEESNWRRGVHWYEEQFAPGAKALSVGEVSTVYAKYPHYDGVPERMASVLPDVRLVYIVRNPLERIRSHYEHRVALGAEREPIERALLDNPIYVDYSRYASQIDRYLECFPREQLRVMTTEALRHDRSRSMHDLYAFLGVDAQFVPASLDREFYKTGERRTYPPALWTARRLLKRYVPQSKRAKEFVDSHMLRRPRPASGPVEKTEELEHPVIPVRMQAMIADMLGEDVHRLRAYLDDGFDGWGLDSGQSTRGGR